MEFVGLTAEQFENYREPRSKSNVYSRPRLEVKEGLLAASAGLVDQFRSMDHEFDVLASDHHPSLWNGKVVDRQFIFFSRGKQEREDLERLLDHDRSLASTLMDPTPYFKYAFLCLCASGDGFETAVKLHWRAWVDRDNLLARLEEGDERESFIELVSTLPEEYTFAVEGGPPRPVTEMDDAVLGEVLEAFRSTERMLTIGLAVDPERAEELGADLVGVASVAFMLLLPVYEALSWSGEDDFISLSEREQAIDEARRAVAEQHKQEREAFESLKRERRQEQARRFEEDRAEKLDHQAYRQEVRRAARAAARRAAEEEAEREAARKLEAVEPTPAPEPPPEKPQKPPPPKPRPARRGRPRPEARGPFEVKQGARVEIATGVLEGKWGVVQEVDHRGQAKVVLGSLVTRVAVGDLREPRRRRAR
jgi:hypothetical protein